MGAQHPYDGIVPTPAVLAPAEPLVHRATARAAVAVAGVTLDELQHVTLDVYLAGLRALLAGAGAAG